MLCKEREGLDLGIIVSALSYQAGRRSVKTHRGARGRALCRLQKGRECGVEGGEAETVAEFMRQGGHNLLSGEQRIGELAQSGAQRERRNGDLCGPVQRASEGLRKGQV